MMRNEDFSEGYFAGRLWAAAWTGSCDSFAEDAKTYIAEAELGTLDRRFWSEGFCYGAKAERTEQAAAAASGDYGDEDDDDEEAIAA